MPIKQETQPKLVEKEIIVRKAPTVTKPIPEAVIVETPVIHDGLIETMRLKVSVGQPSPVPVYNVPEGTASVSSDVTVIKPEFESTIL